MLRIIVAASLFALTSVSQASAQVKQQKKPPSPTTPYDAAVLADAGEDMLNVAIGKYGRAQNPVWRAEVSDVLRRLERAAGMRDTIVFAIVNDPTMDATALPGGYMIVNAGLLGSLARFAAHDFPGDSNRAHARYEGFLANVLGHELAHETLGHVSDVQELVAAATATDSSDATLREVEREMADKTLLKRRQHSRAQELDADRVGSMYALRAGWTIQDGIDFLLTLDGLEKQRQQTVLLEWVTWLRDHPRASDRAANLEQLRATLMSDQSRFDDALTLIRNGVMLDTAVTLLDSVLAHFPHLHPAQHARAAALHRQFIRLTSVGKLAVRSAVATYDANIVGTVRGAAPSTSAMLARARDGYRAVLAEVTLPYALANLAVLDAYAGDSTLARARADSALRLDSADVSVRVNRGAAYFLAGRAREALADFEAARDLCEGPDAVVTFDIGRAQLAAGDSAAARQTLTDYLAIDATGAWHDLAASLVKQIGGAVTSTTAKPAGATGLALPVTLDATPATVRSALGAPDAIDTVGTLSRWQYLDRYLEVDFDSTGRVGILVLDAPEAGAIDGVRVHDTIEKATMAWGPPIDRYEDPVSADMTFRRGTLLVTVEYRAQRITQIQISRRQEK